MFTDRMYAAINEMLLSAFFVPFFENKKIANFERKYDIRIIVSERLAFINRK